jgi:uncharacterized protein
MKADRDAVDVFAQPPHAAARRAARRQGGVGVDPGQRTGCKCVVVDATGKLLATP